MRAPEHPLIVIAGSIGAGKTTLASVLRDSFGMPAWIEHAERNPHLRGLYEDPHRWAFPAHEVFLDHALQRHREAGRAGEIAVVDRSPHETVEVFARMLSGMGHISAAQLAQLRSRLSAAAEDLVRPSLMIYLHAPVDVLLERVRSRAWPQERVMTVDYLTTLAAEYSRFAASWKLGGMLDVDTAAVDLRVAENVERLLGPTGAGVW